MKKSKKTLCLTKIKIVRLTSLQTLKGGAHTFNCPIIIKPTSYFDCRCMTKTRPIEEGYS